MYDEFENILPRDQWSGLDKVSLPVQKPQPSGHGSPYSGSPQYSPNLSNSGRPYHQYPYQQQPLGKMLGSQAQTTWGSYARIA